MNRRSFITKALAGIAAVPLIGKFAQPASAQDWPTELKAFAVHDAADPHASTWLVDYPAYCLRRDILAATQRGGAIVIGPEDFRVAFGRWTGEMLQDLCDQHSLILRLPAHCVDLHIPSSGLRTGDWVSLHRFKYRAFVHHKSSFF